jgi:hypothetical protein
MRVLHHLGLSELVRHDGGLVAEAGWLNQDGRLINRFALPETDFPAIVLHRARLQKNSCARCLPLQFTSVTSSNHRPKLGRRCGEVYKRNVA